MSDTGELSDRRYSLGYGYQQPDYTSWVNQIFPTVGQRPLTSSVAAAIPESWSPAAIELANSLIRTESLLRLEGGIELRRDNDSFDPQWERTLGRSSDLVLYSPSAWATRGMNAREQTIVNYCDAKERTVWSLAFLLGQSRASAPVELRSPPLALSDYSVNSIWQSYSAYTARVEPAGEGHSMLILTLKDATDEIRFKIDTARHVILSQTSFRDGQLTGGVTFEGMIEVAGTWWATKVVSTDEQGRPTSETRYDIKALSKEELGHLSRYERPLPEMSGYDQLLGGVR